MRMKRDIVSIHSPPPAPVLIPGEDQNQSSTAQHCSLRSVNINFDQIGWTHILAPKEVGGCLTFLKHKKLYLRYYTNTVRACVIRLLLGPRCSPHQLPMFYT